MCKFAVSMHAESLVPEACSCRLQSWGRTNLKFQESDVLSGSVGFIEKMHSHWEVTRFIAMVYGIATTV